MIFNPDLQAIEIIFSCKTKKPVHPELSFNDIPIAREDHTKHLGMFLDSRLNFFKHIKEKILKALRDYPFLDCYLNMLIKMCLTCPTKCIYARILIMGTSFSIIKEQI